MQTGARESDVKTEAIEQTEFDGEMQTKFVRDFWIAEVSKEEEEVTFAEKWNGSFDPLFIGLK